MTMLDGLLDSFITMGIPAFDCSVYHKGAEVYRRSYGFFDYEKKLPLHGTELFNIYSSSKIVTVVAIFQLIEQGLVHLEDKLSDFIPEFSTMMVRCPDGIVRPSSVPITIEHLLTMTSGLNYERALERPAWRMAGKRTDGLFSTVESLRCLACEPLEFEPGTSWLYSFSLDVCAAVVEIVSGERFSRYCHEHIFNPLGMQDTSFDLKNVDKDRITAQYRYNPGTREMIACGTSVQNGFILGPEYESGGAGCVSSVDDFMKLLESLRKFRILSESTIRKISRNALPDQVLSAFFKAQNDCRYGYGLGVGCPLRGGDWNCFGWGGAAGSFAGIDLDAELSVFYVQHVLDRPNMIQKRDVYTAAREMFCR